MLGAVDNTKVRTAGIVDTFLRPAAKWQAGGFLLLWLVAAP